MKIRQPGFFDLQNRHVKLVKTRDFLDRVNLIVSWESFRSTLNEALGRKDVEGLSGRPPWDAVLMFKVLVLQALYNLSDEQTEYQILDRLSFMKFLRLEMCDGVPDARTIWLFRENLIKAEAVEKLFAMFDAMLNAAGFEASGGQIVDATFVETPRQRNSRDDNDGIKKGEVPKGWSRKKKAHKDVDARWTKKNNVAFFGYKNHVNIDAKHKLIRVYKVTPASVHDSQELDAVIDKRNDTPDLWADSAYRSKDQEQRLKDAGHTSHIHEKGTRAAPLTEEQKAANTERSRVRVRVEHVFGHIETAMDGCFVRTIGMARAKAKIGMENLAYNISRYAFLTRGATLASV